MKTISQAIDEAQASNNLHELRILDSKAGDILTTWEPSNKKSVDLARTNFDNARKQGLVPYKVSKRTGSTELLQGFDPEADTIILSPPVTGG